MRVVAGDATLYAEQHGGGADLVLLHGVGVSSARVWERVLPSLAERYRILAYDLRGFGRSTNPSGVQSVPRHEADLVALLDQAGIAAAHLVGFSFSGLIVQRVALEHPERVRSLTLASTSAGLPPDLQARYDERAALVERDGIAAWADQQALRSLSPSFATAYPEVAAWYREQFLANDPASYAGAMRAMGSWRFQERLPALRCPALVITGADDESFIRGRQPLEAARELHRLIPGADLVIVPEARHYVQLEQPEAFVVALRGFLDRLERRDRAR